MDNFLEFTFQDYAGQVVEYLETEAKKMYGSSAHWNLICETVLNFFNQADI